jgi:hypothetical protein
MFFESNITGPEVVVTVWSTLSLFVQVTVVPTFTVSGVGLKAKFWIVAADEELAPDWFCWLDWFVLGAGVAPELWLEL